MLDLVGALLPTLWLMQGVRHSEQVPAWTYLLSYWVIQAQQACVCLTTPAAVVT